MNIRLIGALLLILVIACSDPDRIFEQNVDFPDQIWLASDIPSFEFKVEDASRNYNLYYNVRNALSYPYHNLYVRYSLEDSLGNQLGGKLQNMDLFDPISGAPLGDGLGDIFDHRILAIEGQKFSSPGTYRFSIQQFMRQDSLPLILSVGLRVEIAPMDTTSRGS